MVDNNSNKVIFVKFKDTLDNFKIKIENELIAYKTNAVIFIELNNTIYCDGVYYEGNKFTDEDKIILTNKADKDELSNIIGEEVITGNLLDEITTLTREEIKKDLFIDLWNAACKSYGTYNKETKYFELNGLTDITYELAVAIYVAGPITSLMAAKRYNNIKIRTNLPMVVGGDSNGETAYRFDALHIIDNSDIEILNLIVPNVGYNNGLQFSLNSNNNKGTDAIFCNCSKLKKIMGIISLYSINMTLEERLFKKCALLEDVKIYLLHSNINFCSCPKLNFESYLYMILNAGSTSIPGILSTPITITVDANVYAKIMNDITNSEVLSLTTDEQLQWHSLLLIAANKNISFKTI